MLKYNINVQKDDKKLNLLPYGDELDEEAFQRLRELKTYFGSSIVLREPRESLMLWNYKLNWYINLYGLKFSKEDHILFVEILYDLVTLPDMPLSVLSAFTSSLTTLLRKRRFLVPGEDLTLPWRPLYNICKKVFWSSYVQQTIMFISNDLKECLENLLMHVRFYFPPESTREILDELRPYLCPFDNKALKYGVQMLSWFLPLSSSPELADVTYKLWLDEIMQLWEACNNNCCIWEDNVLRLLATLANLNIGTIDWEEYIPLMYSRFLRIFKLPVFYKKTGSLKLSKITEGSAASWIVSTLGGNSKSQDHLDQLLKVLESYCHPANIGYWATIIKFFLKKLSRCFILRVKREKFGKTSWETKIPADKKLTDEDILRFVTSMQSILMQAMFTPSAIISFQVLFHELATLRPDIVIPPLLDKVYSTINSLTEPYKLLAILQNMSGVARPMLVGGLNCSFEGKQHVIPLLFAVLPGIDPNDFRKSITSIQLIATFANMIPFIDCSKTCSSYTDLTPEEEETASATSQFEEFVIQFLDRIFLLIESLIQENVRIENNFSDERNKIEQSVNDVVWESCYPIISQLSHPIFMVALKKVYNYSMFKILEREVAGQAVAFIIQAFAKVNGEETYKMFLPKLCSFIVEAARSQNIAEEETLNDELLYKMLLLSEIVEGDCDALKQYLPMLQEVLDLTLHVKCKEGYEISSQLLSSLLVVFSNIYPKDHRSSVKSYESISDSIPLRDWGKAVNLSNLNINWYQPSEDEIATVEQIFWKYLTRELSTIDKYLQSEIEFSRDQLRCTLTVILSLFSCSNLLAPWTKEPPLKFCESQLDIARMNLNVGVKRYINMPDGSNVYKSVIEKMILLQSKLLKDTDDTAIFILMIRVWTSLLYIDERLESDFKGRKESFKFSKNLFENRLMPANRTIRFILIEDILLKHLQRTLVSEHPFTETHKDVLLKLLELATSDYKPVQVTAQKTLLKMARINVNTALILKDDILKNLKEDTVKFSEKFKSTIMLLKGHRKKEWPPLLHSYGALKDIMAAVVTSVPNEDPLVVKLLNEFNAVVTNTARRFPVNIEIPDYVIERAKNLWTKSQFELLYDIPSAEKIQKGLDNLKKENNVALNDYRDLIKSLLEAAELKNLHWRYELMAVTFLAVFIIPEEPVPDDVVRYFLNLTIHDSVSLRKIAIKCLVCMLKLYKPTSLKEKVDPKSIEYRKPVNDEYKNSNPGPRLDNMWCQHENGNIPRNEQQWNEVRYVYGCYSGYYSWPKELYLHSSSAIQPATNVNVDQLTGVGREIDNFFTNEANLEKLIRFLCIEESKNEPLKCFNIAFFKYVFKVHGDRYTSIFKPHLEKLVDEHLDGHQRCAAEMFSGIMQGMKLWRYESTDNLMQWIIPFFRKILDNMTLENQRNWGSAVASAILKCDINKSNYLLEVMANEPIKEDAAFKDCGRLYALQGCGLYGWKSGDLWSRVLENIKPHLANPYQSLRERLGSVLVSIFETDIEIENWNRTLTPHVSNFIQYLLPKLDILYSVAPNSKSTQDENKCPNNVTQTVSDNEKDIQEAILLLKTVCKWCSYSIQRCVYPLKPGFFDLFPLMCYMENYDKDDEMKKICKNTLSLMSFSLVMEDNIPVFLTAFEKVSESKSWSSKCTGLEFLQVFVFHNLFIISSREEWILKILNFLAKLLEDERCEVRQKAGEVISGFIHYNIIKETENLLNKFKTMRKKPLTKKSNINIRHAGVIGLCSFINAYPYTIPPEVPELFVEIGDHLGDPEPIPSTIRTTLGNFKRTHYADWNYLKTQFTSDQLDVFADISVPPNHYA